MRRESEQDSKLPLSMMSSSMLNDLYLENSDKFDKYARNDNFLREWVAQNI